VPSQKTDDLFLRGKKAYEDDRMSDAEAIFLRCTQEEPNNADYYAWLSGSLWAQERREESFYAAEHALRLSQTCQMAYRLRGNYNYVIGEYRSALNDYSQAIQLDPDDWKSLTWRGHARINQKDYANGLLDIAAGNQLGPNPSIDEWHSDNANIKFWFQTIHRHVSKDLVPKLQSPEEYFITYWPCFLEWGKHSKVHASSNEVSSWDYSSYGTGCCCLTTKGLRLFSSAQLSKRVPMYKSGIKSALISGFTHRQYVRESNDRWWSIPFSSIYGDHLSTSHDNTQYLVLATPTENWDIYPYFNDDPPLISAGISVGRSNAFSQLHPLERTSGESASAPVFELIKQLAELRSQGVLTDEEFAQKKAELLSRL
jgi:hypothetical protein